jgi:hypothetical protein
MTWAEYLIRVDGYRRMDKRQLERLRRTWFNALIGPHVDPKRLPKTERAYLPLGEDDAPKKKVISKYTREKFKKAVADYRQKTGK